MNARGAGVDLSLDRERLKYVTENFACLQGLRSLVAGLAWSLYLMAGIYWERSRWSSILAVLPLIGVLPLTFVYIPRYYRRRFGWIQPRQQQHAIADWSARRIAVTLFAILMLVMGFDVVCELISVPEDTVQSLVMSIFLIYLGFYLGLRWPRRGMYILPIGPLVAFIGLYPLWHHLDTREFFLWRILNAGSCGIGLALMGLCDHITLVLLMPKHVEEEK